MPVESQRVRHDWRDVAHTHTYYFVCTMCKVLVDLLLAGNWHFIWAILLGVCCYLTGLFFPQNNQHLLSSHCVLSALLEVYIQYHFVILNPIFLKLFIFVYYNWSILAPQCFYWTTWVCSVYTCAPTSWASLPPIPFPAFRPSRSTGQVSWWYRAASHQLSSFHKVVWICQCHSLNLSHPLLPLCAHKSVLCVCNSIPALQIGSLVPFF